MNFEGNYYGEIRPAKPMTKEEAESLYRKFKKMLNDELTGSNKVAPTKTKTKKR